VSRYMGRLNSDRKRRRLSLEAARNVSWDRARAHFFVVFRMGDDVCAKCGKPLAEHPRRGIT
jgi:hypothetical protein